MPRRLIALVIAAAALVAASPAYAVSYKNCTELRKTYKHGVGRANAVDRTSGQPVTTFTRDTKAYERAMRANRSLDRDRDGIACEKR